MALSGRKLDKGDYIGITAFVAVALGSYSQFAFLSRINGTELQVIATFVLGGLFTVIGILSNRIIDYGTKLQTGLYFLLQAILGLSCIWISPAMGMFGILCLPLASQSVFLFRWPTALACCLFLYASTAMIFYPQYGWDGFMRGLWAYLAPYVFTVGFTFVTYDAVKERLKSAALTEELQEANQRLRDHASQAEELATTQERNRLAREIHDGVGHYLTVINVQLEAAQSVLKSDPPRAAEAIDKATILSRDALNDVRGSVGSLRTEAQRPPLHESIRQLTEDAGIDIDMTVQGEPRQLTSAADHALFRAAQEGLTNVRKHADAQRSWVKLDFVDPARTRLVVEDNGCGPDTTHGFEGFGLRGMHERIELLGGTVRTGSRRGGGFLLEVEVPA